MSTTFRISAHYAPGSFCRFEIELLAVFMAELFFGERVKGDSRRSLPEICFKLYTDDERLARGQLAWAFGEELPEWEYTIEQFAEVGS